MFLLATPPPQTVLKMGFFHLVSPAGHFGYPPPILGVLSSIISLFLIN